MLGIVLSDRPTKALPPVTVVCECRQGAKRLCEVLFQWMTRQRHDMSGTSLHTPALRSMAFRQDRPHSRQGYQLPAC